MIPALAAATGPSAGDDLRAALADHLDTGRLQLEDAGGLAVAWAPGPWVDRADDGEVLVLVDGHVHHPRAPAGPAALVAARHRAQGTAVAAGMFGDHVVIVLDRRRRTLLVARDPLGVRPWYHASTGRRWVGASTEGAVAAVTWVDDEVDERTAIEHLASVWVSAGRSFHRGVRSLAPGCTAVADDRGVALRRHHRWEIEAELDVTWEEAVERARATLDTAVADRLRSGAPPTSQLSGGIDSSAVVGTAVRLGHRDLVAARLAFDGPAADERSWSDAVVDHWGLTCVTARPWVPGPDEATELTRRIDRPLPDPHFTMFAGLHRALLAAGRPEGLTGLGGDDAFATSGAGSLVVSAVRLGRWRELAALARATGGGVRGRWQGLAKPALHHVARWRGRSAPSWVTSEAAATADLSATLRARPARVTGVAAIDERVENVSSGYDALILEAQAIVSDLEGRRDSHPFLDPRLVEATYGLDPWWPRRDGGTRDLQVAAYRDRLPAVVADRRSKAEFSEIFWGPLLDPAVVHAVRTGPLVDRGWLDRAGFDALVAAAHDGRPNVAIPLSRCVSLDRWLRTR